jgi:TonB family protein
MKLVVRPEGRGLRKASSLGLSACLHGSVLAWVALGPVIPQGPPPSLYDQAIRNHKIVWYNLHERLPDISPAERHDPRPLRARVKAPQHLVAGKQETQRPPQLIWTPAPIIETRQMLPSPNVVALAAPARPVRDFAAPPEAPRAERPAPSLPEAPAIAASQPVAVSLPPIARPQPRIFTPPPEARPEIAQPVLAAAPELTIAMAKQPAAVNALLPLQPARRTFIPPAEATHAPAPQPASLPAAPQIPAAANPTAPAVPFTAVARAVRPFRAPAGPGAPAAPPAAPLADAPEVAAAHRAPEASLAIVGLLPTRNAEIPTPKASQQAGFSAGPQPRPDGGDSDAGTSQLLVPGLLIRDGTKEQPEPTLLASLEPPTSVRNLMAAARSIKVAPSVSAATEPLHAPRVIGAPDRRFDGRLVYTIAIQMPNVTSFSGSWIVWFAEREPVSGQAPDVHPPSPLRKVDPKYIAAAAAEKVEGRVRLAAVIRKNGHVDTVELLQHLDSRLDQSAAEALAKWEFAPALRDGSPVEVDAVFEIPFHLAPRLPK